jgi:hypothetical protein
MLIGCFILKNTTKSLLQNLFHYLLFLCFDLQLNVKTGMPFGTCSTRGHGLLINVTDISVGIASQSGEKYFLFSRSGQPRQLQREAV